MKSFPADLVPLHLPPRPARLMGLSCYFPVKDHEAQKTGGACVKLYSWEAAELPREPEFCVFPLL